MKQAGFVWAMMIIAFQMGITQEHFERHYADFSDELRGISALEAQNGNLYILGQRNAYDSISGNPIEGTLTLGSEILKLDPSGNIVWQHTYDNSFAAIALEAFGRQPARQLLELPDGSLILPYHKFLGILECENPGLARFSEKAGIMRIAATGELIWDRLLDDVFCGHSKPLDAEITDAGRIRVMIADDMDFRLAEVDTSGNVNELFRQQYIFEADGAHAFEENYLVWGKAEGTFYLYQINLQGDSLNTLNVPSAMEQLIAVERIERIADGGVLLLISFRDAETGNIRSGLIRTDANLDIQWQKSLDFFATDVRVLPGGELIASEGSAVQRYGTGIRLWFLDEEANVLFNRNYGGFYDTPVYLLLTNDQYFVATGSQYCCYGTGISPPPRAEIYVLKDELPESLTGIESEAYIDKIVIYPNPTDNFVWIRSSEQGGNRDVAVYDVQGNLLLEKRLSDRNRLVVGHLADGMYVMKIRSVQSGNISYRKLQIRR